MWFKGQGQGVRVVGFVWEGVLESCVGWRGVRRLSDLCPFQPAGVGVVIGVTLGTVSLSCPYHH